MFDLLASGLLVLSVAVSTAAADDIPPFKVTTRRADDRAEVIAVRDRVIVSVQSPFGISHADVERGGEKWPEDVVLRLHLKGLENFKVTNGKVTLEGAASFRGGKIVARVWKDGKEDALLDATHLHWVDVRIVG